MTRATIKDRDRTLLVVSGLTGAITAAAVAATGLATAFAAQQTQRQDALKVAAGNAGRAGLAVEPGGTSTVTEDADDPQESQGTTTVRVRPSTNPPRVNDPTKPRTTPSTPRTTSKKTIATLPPKTTPKPKTTPPKPKTTPPKPPPTKTSGS